MNLHLVAARAASLRERQSLPRLGPSPPELWERWRFTAGGGDTLAFENRLKWDALRDVHLGEVRVSALPLWVERLPSLAARVAAGGTLRDPNDPVPFEEILEPWAEQACAQIDWQGFSPGAQRDAGRALLGSLFDLCGRPLQAEFQIFLSRRSTRLERFLDPKSREHYEAFLEELDTGAFFEEYAVLGRLAVNTLELFQSGTSLLVARLGQDRELLCTELGIAPEDPVASLQLLVADRHEGGQSTAILEFESGKRVVYKPRDMGPAIGWTRLLEWCNAHDVPLRLHTFRVLDRDKYGWVEFVPTKGVQNPADYFRRCGMLLCLIYLLGGTDCHYQNIIPCGDQPVLVDLETVMHPLPRDDEFATQLSRTVVRELGDSVFQSTLLPRWHRVAGVAVDVSGMGTSVGVEPMLPRARWSAINTDCMELALELGAVERHRNPPCKDGVPLSSDDYNADVQHGFRAFYEWVVERRSAWLAADGPLSGLERKPVRFVFRATQAYYQILYHGRNLNALRDGARRSIDLELACRALTQSPDRSLFWPMIGAELASLEAEDIPYFVASTSSHDLLFRGEVVVADAFVESCLESTRRRLQRLGAADLARQTTYIWASLETPKVALHAGASEERQPTLQGTISSAQLVSSARELATDLHSRALGDVDTAVTWLTARFLFDVQKHQIEVLGPDLFGGRVGVALFLAALERFDPGWRALSDAVVSPLCDDLNSRFAPRLARDFGAHGAGGMAGIAYGFTRLGKLESARAAAALIRPEHIDADRRYDVVYGSAGTILGLLALHRACGEAEWLTSAQHAAEHLLGQQQPAGAWITHEDVMPTGFSHGAAGIAYALLRLHSATGVPAYRDAARRAIEWENRHFSPEHGNWRDLRRQGPGQPIDDTAFAAGWCNGGPGIALARVGGLEALDTPELRGDAEAGLQVSLGQGLRNLDTVCCGNLGLADILLECGRRLQRDELVAAAAAVAAASIKRAQQSGFQVGWSRSEHGSIAFPGFYQGVSGIGYSLLRLADQALPSVLLWD